jgi:hypothetical protein
MNNGPALPHWITPDGINLAEMPVDFILRQTLNSDFERFRSGCTMLGSMARTGRLEAGVYLIGLLGYYASDLRRLEVIADQLGHFRHAASANTLLAEIRRVKNSNATRRYLDWVLRSLALLPTDFVKSGLQALAEDSSFSSKMRARFWDICEKIRT